MRGNCHLTSSVHRLETVDPLYVVAAGFGMTTPRTTLGKVALILYGFLGCAGGFLFFNLFLERIITFLAYILRYIHERDMRRKGLMSNGGERRGSQVGECACVHAQQHTTRNVANHHCVTN